MSFYQFISPIKIMKLLQKCLLGLMLIPCGLLFNPGTINASQVVTQWYFGSWDCNIDGRNAKMQWLVVDDPQTQCDGDICRTTSGVKVVGQFSNNGSAWVSLAKHSANVLENIVDITDNLVLIYRLFSLLILCCKVDMLKLFLRLQVFEP